MTPTRLLFAGLFFASGFVYQVTANVILLTDGRSITAYSQGYVIVPTLETRTDGPRTRTPPVAFGTFPFTTVSANVFGGASSSANQASLISAQSHTTLFYASGGASGLISGGPETLVSSVQSSSIYRLGFALDAAYQYETVFTLSAEYLTSASGAYPTQAGYRLTGPSGEVFSFVRERQTQGYGQISGSSNGSLVPGNYVFEAWANTSGDAYRGSGYTAARASYGIALGLTPAGETPVSIPPDWATIAVPDAGCPAWLCAGTLLGLVVMARRLRPGRCLS
jgi:hypothetical protein